MVSKTAGAGYSGTAKFLHWLILALLIAQFIFAWTMPHIRRDTPVGTLIGLHFSFGVLILLVAVVRLGWRVTQGEPKPIDGMPPWQVQIARLVHWLLYVLLFFVPIVGWLNASWRGMPVSFFGLFDMPNLIAKGAPDWRWTGWAHVRIGEYGILGLVGLHVLAVLYHQVVSRFGMLQRMLPGMPSP